MAAQLATENTTDPSPTASGGYRQFSSLPLFASADNDRHATLATPALAKAWADAILCYWQLGVGNASIDPNKPLYLLDLAPRQGQLAWLMLNALRQKLQASALALQPCYLICSKQEDARNALLQHPYLADYVTERWLDVAEFGASGTLHLQQQDIALLRSDNPIVILGLGHFQTLPSELFGVHHGKIMEGRVTTSNIEDDDAIIALDYQWQTPDQSPALAEPLLAHYLSCCPSASLLLPLAACSQIDLLRQLSTNRYLLLSVDAGACTSQQIRLGALRPPATWCAADSAPPVNIHALQLHQQQHGAWTWHQQLDETGFVLHAACCDSGNSMDEQCFGSIIDRLTSAHPDDHRQLLLALNDPESKPNAASTLALLRLSDYDPHVLKAFIHALTEHPPALDQTARKTWQLALSRTWANTLPPVINDGFYYQLGLLAAQLEHFSLARECFQLGLAWYGDDAADCYLLAWCEAATGGAATAMALVERALALEPNHAHSLALRAALDERLQRWTGNTWYLPQHANDGELRLEPLGPEHAVSLFYQYRDEQIGIMTRLPELTTVEQVHDWIGEQQQDARRASFAVMHACWGLVGMVSMHSAGSAGYFYFWIGSDFQDQGLGQQAAKLLLEMMLQNGVTDVFTSAYEDNVRSIHALGKLGFYELSVRAQEPDETLAFFYWGQSTNKFNDEQAVNTALRDLCRAIDSSLQFLS